MSTLPPQLVDDFNFMDDLTNFTVDPDSTMVDPQLSVPYFDNLSGKAPVGPTTVDSSLWQTPVDTSERFDFVQPQGYQPGHFEIKANPFDDFDDSASVANSSPVDAQPPSRQDAPQPSHRSSKSSVPSLSSGSTGSPASPGRRETRSKTTKKPESKPKAKPARKKQKTSKKTATEPEQEQLASDNEGSSRKRNKYLERNRVAASKCRQKKKVWVSDLETTKNELEQKHSNLQREYTGLVDEVTQLKNQLMSHAGCGDQRINGWIETEAKRFVQRTTENGASQRRMSSVSSIADRRPSQAGSTGQDASPALSASSFPQSPAIKEEINYDHMPDNMFN